MRKPGQPFFMQVQLAGGKLRRRNRTRLPPSFLSGPRRNSGAAVKPDDVTLPPYYPRDPVLLRDWAAYLDSVRFTDRHVGQVLARLEKRTLSRPNPRRFHDRSWH